MRHLLAEVKPYLWTENRGGTVLLVQVENEFGAYGDTILNKGDRMYMEKLHALYKEVLGPEAALFACDQAFLLPRV